MQVYTSAGSGDPGSFDAQGEDARFNYPMGIAVDKEDQVIVTDNHFIRKILPDLKVITLAGNGKFGCEQGIGCDSTFYDPSGVAVDSAGNLIIADRINNCIRKLGSTQYFKMELMNKDENIDKLGFKFEKNEMENLLVIEEITFQGLVDKWNQIHQSRPVLKGDSICTVNGISDNLPEMLEALMEKNLTIDVRRTGTVSILAGSTVGSFVNGKAGQARFFHPAGVAVDKDDNVLVADKNNHCIRKIDPDGNVTTLAGNENPGWTDRKGVDANFNSPSDLAIYADGNVFVADQMNHCIRMISPDGDVSTIAGTGRAEFNDASSKKASFNSPTGIAVDTSGNLFVADRMNNRIRKVVKESETKWRVSTIAGNGGTAFVDGKAETSSVFHPFGVAVSTDGNVFFTDSSNRKVRVVHVSGQEAPMCQLVASSKLMTDERLERERQEAEEERRRQEQEKKNARELARKQTQEKQKAEREAKKAKEEKQRLEREALERGETLPVETARGEDGEAAVGEQGSNGDKAGETAVGEQGSNTDTQEGSEDAQAADQESADKAEETASARNQTVINQSDGQDGHESALE